MSNDKYPITTKNHKLHFYDADMGLLVQEILFAFPGAKRWTPTASGVEVRFEKSMDSREITVKEIMDMLCKRFVFVTEYGHPMVNNQYALALRLNISRDVIKHLVATSK